MPFCSLKWFIKMRQLVFGDLHGVAQGPAAHQGSREIAKTKQYGTQYASIPATQDQQQESDHKSRGQVTLLAGMAVKIQIRGGVIALTGDGPIMLRDNHQRAGSVKNKCA